MNEVWIHRRSCFALAGICLLMLTTAATAADKPNWAPTLGDLLKNHGYATGQFGKNHLGDQDKHLPTNHGFDEFFGNLYHLNAEEEPQTYDYPKDPEFRKKFAPREQIFYFGQGGELNAVRWNDWKVHFAQLNGAINTAVRDVTAWPAIIHLKADPYEHAWQESELYTRWMIDNMWLFVPIQQQIETFIGSLEGYPFQEGQTLNAAGINYQSLKAMKILQQINKKGLFDSSIN